MKDYTVVIDYDNYGTVCQYFYCEGADTMKQALDEALEEFRNFMKLNGKAVEILEINAFIHHDPYEEMEEKMYDDETMEYITAKLMEGEE